MTSPSRMGSVVAMIDRLFPLAWIGFYLLLPVSGWAPIMFRSWFDQRRDLAALRSVLTDGHADAIAGNLIGPSYIAAARFLHATVRLSPEDSLVVLTRVSYALGVALGVLLVGVLVRRVAGASPLVSLAAQFTFAALVFSAGTWYWSDVPWSHFFAAFLALAFYAIRFGPERRGLPHAALIGAVLSLLALARSFELSAVVLAWAIGAAAVVALGLSPRPRISGAHVLAGLGGLLVSAAAVYAATGKRDLFFLYSGNLDQQSGNVAAAEVAQTPTFSLEYVPVKLVQLFVEPCYYSLCTVADYAGGASPLPANLAGAAGNERLWRLPLAVQLPSLTLLPLSVLAMTVVLVWAARHRRNVADRTREIQGLLEMTVAATGLVLGYAASTMTGSSHLRYGFARDFLLPALLAAVVSVTLASIGLWTVLSRRRLGLSPVSAFVALSVVGAAVLVTSTAYARAHGIPRIEGKQLGTVSYTASCRRSRCVVSISARTRAGRPISIPESSTLTFGCGSDRARFTIYARRLSGGIRLTRLCPSPRLVAAWPTVMGLPPGSYELSAVMVKNAA